MTSPAMRAALANVEKGRARRRKARKVAARDRAIWEWMPVVFLSSIIVALVAPPVAFFLLSL